MCLLECAMLNKQISINVWINVYVFGFANNVSHAFCFQCWSGAISMLKYFNLLSKLYQTSIFVKIYLFLVAFFVKNIGLCLHKVHLKGLLKYENRFCKTHSIWFRTLLVLVSSQKWISILFAQNIQIHVLERWCEMIYSEVKLKVLKSEWFWYTTFIWFQSSLTNCYWKGSAV